MCLVNINLFVKHVTQVLLILCMGARGRVRSDDGVAVESKVVDSQPFVGGRVRDPRKRSDTDPPRSRDDTVLSFYRAVRIIHARVVNGNGGEKKHEPFGKVLRASAY